MIKDVSAIVKSNCKIAENIYKITLILPENSPKLRGGQFVNLSTGDNALLLRRPLGVCTVEGNELSLCYQVKGRGTTRLTEAKTDDELKVLLPLGNGFQLSGYNNVAVIGGGVGVFPLIATIRDYSQINFYSYIGFRNSAAVCLLDELEKSKSLTVTTDDGSYGQKGNAVSAFLADYKEGKFDAIVSCGPPIMLKILKQELSSRNIKIPCFVSLEERMGCGIGACLVCVCKKSDGGNTRVCKDGPVFNIDEVEL